MLSSKLNRRELLKKAGRYSLTSVLGFNYGCSIAAFLGNDQKQTAIIYGTKYGATRDTALWIHNGMGMKADLFNIEDIALAKTAEAYDHFILGSGIWIDGVHDRLQEFLKTQAKLLTGKIAATFIVCGTDGGTESGRKRINVYFEEFHASIAVKPPLTEYFGGRIIVEKLTDEDREILIDFYRTYLNSELTSWDRTEPEKAGRFGMSLTNTQFDKTSRVIDNLLNVYV